MTGCHLPQVGRRHTPPPTTPLISQSAPRIPVRTCAAQSASRASRTPIASHWP
jgi:hypothetical protein